MVSRRWFDVFRLAGQTASRAVSLFLDGDVSFLPDNSFPSHIQLLEVCPCMDLCTRVTADILYSNSVSSYLVTNTKSSLPHCAFNDD